MTVLVYSRDMISTLGCLNDYCFCGTLLTRVLVVLHFAVLAHVYVFRLIRM